MTVVALPTEERLRRLRIVRCCVESGDEFATAKFDIPPEVLRTMQAEDWWADAAKEVYAAQCALLDRKLSSVIDKALVRAEERLDQGDVVIDKLGDSHYLPLKGREAATIAALFMEKRQVLRGLPGSIIKADINLSMVADKLRAIVRDDPVAAQAVDKSALEIEGARILDGRPDKSNAA